MAGIIEWARWIIAEVRRHTTKGGEG